MLQIKRNSKEFKEVQEIISDYAEVSGRKRWILLYALKPHQTLSARILLNTRKQDSEVLYKLAYDSLTDYFKDRSKKLFRDQKTGVYYFKTNAASKW
ncbi:MAG: hypothetical protein ABIP51_21720, partial [Bacteroidia bacterium]